MMRFSVLDLCPVSDGQTVEEALRNALELAQHLERLNFPRIWYAEHHNMEGIASAATSIIIGQVLSATSKIVVGAGGVMLPNHSPLIIAEQFGTLATLFPKRVELGVGRAPGTDQHTAHALRRHLAREDHSFPADVIELLSYFAVREPDRSVRAVPGEGTAVPIWILGSSLYGAKLAAMLGLPYAFASHFAPAELKPALHLYHSEFRASAYLDRPRAMVAVNIVVAPTDDEAKYLFSSQQQAFVNLRSGKPGKLPAPVRHYIDNLTAQQLAILHNSLSCSVIGSPQTVERGLEKLTGSLDFDEIIVSSMIYDFDKRKESFTLLSAIINQH